MTTDHLKRYRDKAKQSFKTKRELFLFKIACEGRKNFAVDEFNQFEITGNLVDEHTSKYWQWEESTTIGDKSIGSNYRFI